MRGDAMVFIPALIAELEVTVKKAKGRRKGIKKSQKPEGKDKVMKGKLSRVTRN
jgi:hypothetical protein